MDGSLKRWKGRIALVTGASSGIGRSIAITLGQLGMNVAIGGRDTVRLNATGKSVAAAGAKILDTAPATIEALPRVLDKIEGRIPVLVDGGIRRGTDVLKALAYGASAVLIGRPYLYGLGFGGAGGVSHVLDILVHELRMAIALTGRSSIAKLDRTLLWDKSVTQSL